jgi:uncharacterized repeat protein (TIGR01451 family)
MARPRDSAKVPKLQCLHFPLSFSKPAFRAACVLFALINPLMLRAASNPVPFISAISPTAVAPGGPDFTLTVRGTGFINGLSTVFWNGAPLPDPTTCVAANPPQLASCTVAVRAAMIATAATASITVMSAGPGGGTSNLAFLLTTNPTNNASFGSVALPSSPQNSRFVVEGDFNGDGKLDLAIPNLCGTAQNCAGYSTPGTVSILLGNGDGTFTPTATPPTTGFNPGMIATGDFNGDGKLDLLVDSNCDNIANVACATVPESISVLLGDGQGNFTPFGPPMVIESDHKTLIVGDFNGDGKLDFAILPATINERITIFFGKGDGTFTPKVVLSGDTMADATFIEGDFNSDGNPDLAIQLCVGGTSVSNCTWGTSILAGDGAGNFMLGASYPNPAPTGYKPTYGTLASGDFNGDGTLDLAVLNQHFLTILLGNGDGTFTALPSMAAPNLDGPQMMTGDFNGDGRLDLAVASGPSVYFLFGDRAGNFPDVFSRPMISSVNSWVAGDFNQDGRLDLMATLGSAGDFARLLLQSPDLTTSLSHAGTFSQGQAGATYSIAVTNNGSVASSGLVTITDTLPAGLIATAMTGSGWDCSANSFPVVGNGTATAICTRSDVLEPAAGYPAITLTTNVAADAPAGVTNTATVSGGNDGNISNNTANDPTTVVTYNVYLPSSAGFGLQVVGSTSSPVTATLRMDGTGTLDISSIALSGDFAQTNDCGSTLDPGASCTITITFTPTAPGKRTGSIIISDNAPTSPQTLPLSGTGIQPAVTLSPTSLTFGSQIVGNVGLPQNFTVTNSGTSPLNISKVVASGSFGDSVGCTSPIPVGSTCSISVFFDPASSGSINGTLTITDDAPGSPHTVALSGTGQDFSLASTGSNGTAANIASGLTASYVLSLAPAGGFSQPVAFTCSGAPAKSTCNVNPAVVTLNPTSPTAVMVTVATTASTMGLPGAPPPPPIGAPPILVWPLATVLAGAVLALARRKRGRVPLRLAFGTAVLMVAVLGVFSMPGCGGTMVQAPVIHTAGTPSGTYNIDVTGTYSTGATTLSHSVQLTLKVQ